VADNKRLIDRIEAKKQADSLKQKSPGLKKSKTTLAKESEKSY
jgi:hypothetical protein